MSHTIYVVCEKVFAQPHISRRESVNVLGAFASKSEAEGWAQNMLRRESPNSNEYQVYELVIGEGSTEAIKPVAVATNWERGRPEDVMKMHRWIDND